MDVTDNPDTTGMDGADRSEWHTPQRETDSSMFWSFVGTVIVLALLAFGVVVLL